MFLFSVDSFCFILLHGTKHFLSIASHSHITHDKVLYCLTSLAIYGTQAKNRTVCWEICSVLFSDCDYVQNSTLLSYGFCNTEYVYCTCILCKCLHGIPGRPTTTLAKMCSIWPKHTAWTTAPTMHCAWPSFSRETNEWEVMPDASEYIYKC